MATAQNDGASEVTGPADDGKSNAGTVTIKELLDSIAAAKTSQEQHDMAGRLAAKLARCQPT